jgi:OTU domain-containing protein 5
MEYVLKEQQFFKSFIEGGDIQGYVARKRCNGEWGDDVELQAMSEIYDRPIEIYAYDTKPMKTFHE